MIVLGIETATAACGVALVGADGLLGTIQIAARLVHSERLVPMIDALFAESGVRRTDLQGVAVSQGPGSFTGLRIGVTTAKAIALALGLPVVGVPTLAALAANAGPAAGLVWPAIVAKRDEVYGAVYAGGEEPRPLGEPWACPPDELLARAAAVSAANGAKDAAVWLVGDAYLRFAAAVGPGTLSDGVGVAGVAGAAGADEAAAAVHAGRRLIRLGPDAALPQAATVARLGRAALLRGAGEDPAALAPLYVRRPQAEIVWDARRRAGEKDCGETGAGEDARAKKDEGREPHGRCE